MPLKIYSQRWLRWYRSAIARWQPIAISSEYREWRDRFIYNRYWLAIKFALAYFTANFAVNCYSLFIATSLWKNADLLARSQQLAVAAYLFRLVAIAVNSLVARTRWGRHHPVWLFLCLSESIHFIPNHLLVVTLPNPRIPNNLDITFFMVQALIVPVCWRAHLVSQLPSLFCWAFVYPSMGLVRIDWPIIWMRMFLLSGISLVSVYLYERLKMSEFESQQQLQRFISSIVHDLRNPIVGMQMLLQSLRQNARSGAARLSLADIDGLLAGNDRLLSLMNSLLDVHLHDRPNLRIDPRPVRLRSLVDGVLAELQSSILKHRVRLIDRLPADLPDLSADPQLLWRVLANLLTNAWMHNQPGITVILTAEICEGRMLRFTIRDNGTGIIDPDRLFEPYARAEEAKYRPGLGLGLAIARQIILAHGGEIGVDNDGGAIFWFTVPI